MTQSERIKQQWADGKRKGGWKHTEKWKQENSIRMKGKKFLGRILTEEHKKKLGDALRGRKLHKLTKETKEKISQFQKGNKYWVGKKHTLETRKKMSLAKIGRFVGKNSSNWKGGITPENIKIRHSIEFRLWRESVFARDNWTCQKYGIKGGKLHPHHIQNFAQYPELRFAIDNGITFSDKAHREFHKRYGIKNNTREQLLEFITKN